MASPTTRVQFKENCLRRLGKPVIEINVDDDQVEDRIDEARCRAHLHAGRHGREPRQAVQAGRPARPHPVPLHLHRR